MSETLIDRIARLQGELNTFEGRENLTQDETDRKNWVSNQLAEAKEDLKMQQQREQAIEEKVQEDIAFTISGVDLSVVPGEWMNVIERVVKADRRRIYAEHAVELEQLEDEGTAYIAHAEGRISNQDKALEALRQDYEKCARELHEQEIETVRLVGERDDYKGKLANAVVQIDEKDAEISRLNDQISDYQKAKVFGEREAQNIIEVNTSEADDINKAIAKAKETWEEKANRGLARWDLPTIETPALEPVTPFRDEAATTESSDDTIPAAEETTLELPQFQSETEAGLELALPAPSEQTEVSRQDIEAIERRLEQLERKVFGEVAA